MKITVYLDMLILINFIINYYLLKISSICAGTPQKGKRLLFSAGVGSLFSLAVFMDIRSVFLSFAIKVFSVILCAFLAFGYNNLRYFLRMVLYLSAANALLAGVLMAFCGYSDIIYAKNMFFYINISPLLMVGCISAVYLVLLLADFFLVSRSKGDTYDFEIVLGICTVKGRGFYDSGFQLKDIMGGRAVMMCAVSLLQNCPEIRRQTESYIQGGKSGNLKIFPIFYSDISGGGMLPAIKADKVECTNKKGRKIQMDNILLAVSRDEISRDVQILFGREILNMTGD